MAALCISISVSTMLANRCLLCVSSLYQSAYFPLRIGNHFRLPCQKSEWDCKATMQRIAMRQASPSQLTACAVMLPERPLRIAGGGRYKKRNSYIGCNHKVYFTSDIHDLLCPPPLPHTKKKKKKEKHHIYPPYPPLPDQEIRAKRREMRRTRINIS